MKYSDFILIESDKLLSLDNPQLLSVLQNLEKDKIIWELKGKSLSSIGFKFNTANYDKVQDALEEFDPEESTSSDGRKVLTIATKNLKITLKSSAGKGNTAQNNKGLQLENELAQALQSFIGVKKGEISDPVCREIMEVAKLEIIKEVKMRGAENSKRNIIIFKKPEVLDIGDTVSDIDLIGYDKSGKVQTKHLSLKYGTMITYLGRGVKGDYIKDSDYTTKKLSLPNGKKLFEILGIPEDIYFDVFNRYTDFKAKGEKKTNIIQLENYDTQGIYNIVCNALGCGYIMVHKIGSNYEIEEITPEYLKSYKNVTGIDFKYTYGAKRVDLLLKFAGNKRMKIAIRNKQGGLYATHINVDYAKDGFKFSGSVEKN